MLEKIMKTILPKRLTEGADERWQKTVAVTDTSRKARRHAEANMILAYREMGEKIQRHPWRD